MHSCYFLVDPIHLSLRIRIQLQDTGKRVLVCKFVLFWENQNNNIRLRDQKKECWHVNLHVFLRVISKYLNSPSFWAKKVF